MPWGTEIQRKLWVSGQLWYSLLLSVVAQLPLIRA